MKTCGETNAFNHLVLRTDFPDPLPHQERACVYVCVCARACMCARARVCVLSLVINLHSILTLGPWIDRWVTALGLTCAAGSGSGSGYIHRRSQSMAINVTEQGERVNCFYIGLHFYLSLPCLLKLCWVVTTVMFKIWLKTLLLSVLFS